MAPPTPVPLVDEIIGEQRWTPGDSPIVLGRDLVVPAGTTLVIEAGVDVLLNPDVAINVTGGELLALGQPGQPVRFVANGPPGARWEAIYGLEDSLIVLEFTEIAGGGAGGTVLASEEGELSIRDSQIYGNGGTLVITDSKLDMRNTEIAGNDMPFGGALNATYTFGNFVTLINNRIGGNNLFAEAAGVDITNLSTFSGVILDVQGNLFRGGVNNLRIATNGPVEGLIACNALIGDNAGLGLRSQQPQLPMPNLVIENNFIAEHTPAITPTYLEFGIGRGAISEVLVDMRNNWWGDESGPYHPEENPEGRGEAVGVNITFDPWLRAPPPCAPQN
jgi:hypothetical protein